MQPAADAAAALPQPSPLTPPSPAASQPSCCAQRALGEARICLLNAGPTGTESLKNLVLPGCGFVTVVDGEKVTEGDVGNNFFVSRADIGSPRAEVRPVGAAAARPWIDLLAALATVPAALAPPLAPQRRRSLSPTCLR